MVRVDYGWGSAQVRYGVCDAHAFPERHYSDFGLEEVDVQFEENVACYFLFYNLTRLYEILWYSVDKWNLPMNLSQIV